MGIFHKKSAQDERAAQPAEAAPGPVYHDKTADEVLQALSATEEGLWLTDFILKGVVTK